MSGTKVESELEGQDKPSRIPIIVTVAALALMGVLWLLCLRTENQGTLHQALTCAFLMSQVVVISLVIWQACDPFADAAQWIGKQFRIPGSIRRSTTICAVT